MTHRSNYRTRTRVSVPLLVKLPELTGPLPALTAQPRKAANTSPARQRSIKRRPDPAIILARIAEDAVQACHGAKNCSIVTVPPADSSDPVLLFLRHDGTTQLMVGVPPDVVRSARLRGDSHRRSRRVERSWELLRVEEARSAYDAANRHNEEEDDDRGGR